MTVNMDIGVGLFDVKEDARLINVDKKKQLRQNWLDDQLPEGMGYH